MTTCETPECNDRDSKLEYTLINYKMNYISILPLITFNYIN